MSVITPFVLPAKQNEPSSWRRRLSQLLTRLGVQSPTILDISTSRSTLFIGDDGYGKHTSAMAQLAANHYFKPEGCTYIFDDHHQPSVLSRLSQQLTGVHSDTKIQLFHCSAEDLSEGSTMPWLRPRDKAWLGIHKPGHISVLSAMPAQLGDVAYEQHICTMLKMVKHHSVLRPDTPIQLYLPELNRLSTYCLLAVHDVLENPLISLVATMTPNKTSLDIMPLVDRCERVFLLHHSDPGQLPYSKIHFHSLKSLKEGEAIQLSKSSSLTRLVSLTGI